MKSSSSVASARRPAGGGLSAGDMLVFAEIARTGGIRNAAKVLGVPRSTVSRQLGALEAVVGVPLVRRTTRQFVLTEQGRILASRSEQLEALVRSSEELIARNAREPVGILRVAASPIVGEEVMPELVAGYLTRYPNVSIQMQLSLDYVDLQSGAVDVALRTGPLEDTMELRAVRLGVSAKGLFASPSYLERRGRPRTLEELADHECILVGNAAREGWWFDSRSGRRRVAISGRLQVDSHRLAELAAAAGAGIVRVPSFFASPLVASGALVPLLQAHWPRATLYAVHPAERPVPAKVRTFVELLREAFAERFL